MSFNSNHLLYMFQPAVNQVIHSQRLAHVNHSFALFNFFLLAKMLPVIRDQENSLRAMNRLLHRFFII